MSDMKIRKELYEKLMDEMDTYATNETKAKREAMKMAQAATQEPKKEEPKFEAPPVEQKTPMTNRGQKSQLDQLEEEENPKFKGYGKSLKG